MIATVYYLPFSNLRPMVSFLSYMRKQVRLLPTIECMSPKMDTTDMLDTSDAILTNFQSKFPLQFRQSSIHITWSNCFSQVDVKVHYQQPVHTRERWTDLKTEFIQPDHPGVDTTGWHSPGLVSIKAIDSPNNQCWKSQKNILNLKEALLPHVLSKRHCCTHSEEF